MDNVTIYINGESLDLWGPDKVNISATYAISDINDIEATKNSVTKEIKVPATNKNKRIFGYADDINAFGYINQREEYRGLIECAGVEVMKGKIKMLKSVSNDDKEFVFNIIGDNGDWRNYLDGVKLRVLDLTDQDHKYTKANIDATETFDENRLYIYPLLNNGRVGDYKALVNLYLNGAYNPALGIYVKRIMLDLEGSWQIPPGYTDYVFLPAYPPENLVGKQIVVSLDGQSDIITTVVSQSVVAMGQFTEEVNGVTYVGAKQYLSIILPDDIELTDANTGTVSLLQGNTSVKVYDRIPAIQLKGLLDRVFKGSGYRVKSNWLQNTGRRLYLIRETDNSKKISDEEADDSAFKVGLSGNKTYNPGDPDAVINGWTIPKMKVVEFDNVEFDNGFLYNTDEHYFTPTTEARYGFTFKGLITALPIGNFQVYIIKSTLDGYFSVIGSKDLENDTEPAIDFDFEMSVNTQAYQAFIKPGERVYVLIGNQGNYNNSITLKASGTSFENELYNPVLTYAATISLNRFLPDISGLDLLKSIKQTHNLYFFTDVERGIVYMEPRDQFYKPDIVDYSGKIDLDKDREIEELGQDTPKNTVYEYMQDAEDNRAKLIEEATKVRPGARTMTILNLFATEDTQENINDSFCTTLMDKCIQGDGAIVFNNTEIPYVRNGEERIAFDTRLLYFDGIVGLPPGETWRFEGTTKYSYPKFFSIDRSDYNYNSLYFDDAEKSVGLCTKHYGGLYEEINESRLLRAFLNLKPIDIEPFVNIDRQRIQDYRALFYIGTYKEGAYYRLNKIEDFNPLTRETTKVEFIKEVDKSVLPIYPAFAPIFINATATETVAGGNTNLCITLENRGSYAGEVAFKIKMPGTETNEYMYFEFDGGDDRVKTICQSIPVEAGLTSGSYTIELMPEDPNTTTGIYGEAELYVIGCSTPADLKDYGITYNPPLGSLQAGGSLAITFTIKNTGCLTGSGAVYFTAPGLTAPLTFFITNLPGGASTNRTFTIYDLPEGTFTGTFSGTNVTIDETVNIVVEASNPNTPPYIIARTPEIGQTGVSTGTYFEIEWNVPVTIQPNKYLRLVKYYNEVGGGGFQAAAYWDTQFTFITPSTIRIYLPAPLEGNKNYGLWVDGGFVKNGAGLENVEVPINTWYFKTVATANIMIGDDFLGENRGGYTRYGGVPFAIARAATIAGSKNTAAFECGLEVWNGGTATALKRLHIYFDTPGAWPVGATLDSAQIQMNINSNNAGAKIVQSTTTVLTFNSYSEKDTVLLGEVTATASGQVTVNVPVSSINLSGKTGFVFLNPNDFNNVAPGTGNLTNLFSAQNFRLILNYHL